MEAAKNVTISLNLTQDDIEIATLIGLLHDIGRYSIINDIDHQEAYVLEINGEIVATAMISKALEPNYNYIDGKWLQNANYITVHRIAIRNDQKGNGLAKIIMDEAAKL